MNLDAERERLRGLASKATAGPWKTGIWTESRTLVFPESDTSRIFVTARTEEDAAFIAAAHDMLALIDAQASALAEMQERCAKAAENEKVEEISLEDRAYNMAIDHSAAAIRALGKGT